MKIWISLLLFVLAAQFTTAMECYAQDIISFEQGMRSDGTPVAAHRSDPTNALGMPQMDDTVNFVSLGFGGTLILDVGEYPFLNVPGTDLTVIETSYDNPSCSQYPETVHAYASNDLDTWEDLGTGCLDSPFDLGGLETARYIKLVDETNVDQFGGGLVDAYDVDGIIGECTDHEIPEFGLIASGIAMIGAIGAFFILRKR